MRPGIRLPSHHPEEPEETEDALKAKPETSAGDETLKTKEAAAEATPEAETVDFGGEDGGEASEEEPRG
jgi:hypothetical protein